MTHRDFFFQILDMLEVNNIEYVLFAGTLLGAIRDNDFLPCDQKDTDIALDDKYYWIIRKLFEPYINSRQLNWQVFRKEISIYSIDKKLKVDMFFMEKQQDQYLVYSYKQNNINNNWDYEWRAKFTATYFFPSKIYSFLDRPVSVPNNAEALLTEEYGTWRIPDSNWVSTDTTVLNTDKEYLGFTSGAILQPGKYTLSKSNIGIIMTTLLRPDITKECIMSIRQYYADIKIYMIDQDSPSEEMITFYEANNVQYYYNSDDIGLSYARNFLLAQMNEPYFMIIDNDFIFTDTTKIEIMQEILQQDPAIGMVAGRLENTNDYVHHLIYDKPHKKLYYITLPFTWVYSKPNNYPYCYSDLILNFFLARKEVWEDCKWDNELKLAEHTDYFLRLKTTKWKPVFTPKVIAIHKSVRNPEYLKCRARGRYYLNLFAKKIGLKSYTDIITLKDVPCEFITNTTLPDPAEVHPTLSLTSEQVLIDITNLFEENTISYVLLRDSCKHYIVNQNIVSPIQIGCLINEDVHRLLVAAHYQKIDSTVYTKNNVKIFLINEVHSQFKLGVTLSQKSFKVPYPVVEYLTSIYGEKWNK